MIRGVREVRCEWARRLSTILDTAEVCTGFEPLVEALRLAADLLKQERLANIHEKILVVDKRKPGATAKEWRGINTQLRKALMPCQVLYSSQQLDPELKELGFMVSVVRHVLGRSPRTLLCKEAGNRGTLMTLPEFLLHQVRAGYTEQQGMTKKAA
ncbi:MAG: hypothetical protein E6P95_01990 [Candidatus Moraniibacteriota bacterium]|nr:MAG: hypothetical protein E6P95_01990 [Candidatus Moranbacteria bacterium]